MVTAEIAQMAVRQLRAISGDDEAAHSAEDELRGQVLRTIASGTLTANQATVLAQVALTTEDVEFARWYA